MKRFYLVIFLVIAFLAACSSRNEPGAMAPDADPNSLPQLEGTYVINGIDPLGDAYGGHLTVSLSENPDIYNFQWIVVGGIQEGVGVLKGNQLLVDWHTIEGVAQTSGSAVFTITESGQLYGVRTAEGLDGEGVEQAYPNQ